jgi:hypothetical protein
MAAPCCRMGETYGGMAILNAMARLSSGRT